jgi:transposase
MKKQRKYYTPEEKVAILRRHLLEQVPISELCGKQGLQLTVFYRWQKESFENGAAAFQPKARSNHSAEQQHANGLRRMGSIPPADDGGWTQNPSLAVTALNCQAAVVAVVDKGQQLFPLKRCYSDWGLEVIQRSA